MESERAWAEDLLETLIFNGPEVVLSIIVENGPIHCGPVGLLWDDTAESVEVLRLAQTLAEIGRAEEALEALVLVAHYQWAHSAAA